VVIGNPPKILVIKSDTSELNNVEVFVKELFTENNIPEKYFNKVFLCVSEAVVNSIQHGNKNDCNKEVSIFADCESATISVEIKDEGDGFYLEEVADPTSQENIKKETGRGLHIIKSLSEQIEYNRNSIQFKIECK
jgi:serine/threonine-protein kinase RsbW